MGGRVGNGGRMRLLGREGKVVGSIQKERNNKLTNKKNLATPYGPFSEIGVDSPSLPERRSVE